MIFPVKSANKKLQSNFTFVKFEGLSGKRKLSWGWRLREAVLLLAATFNSLPDYWNPDKSADKDLQSWVGKKKEFGELFLLRNQRIKICRANPQNLQSSGVFLGFSTKSCGKYAKRWTLSVVSTCPNKRLQNKSTGDLLCYARNLKKN